MTSNENLYQTLGRLEGKMDMILKQIPACQVRFKTLEQDVENNKLSTAKLWGGVLTISTVGGAVASLFSGWFSR